MAPDLSAELITPDYAGALCQDVFVHVWRAQVNVETVGAARRFVAPRDDRIRAVVAIIEEGSTTPDDATRALLAALHLECKLVSVAVVHESKGFKGAAVRAVVTGLHLVRPTSFETKVFASVPESLAWMKRSFSRIAGVSELEGFISGLRRRLAAPTATNAPALG